MRLRLLFVLLAASSLIACESQTAAQAPTSAVTTPLTQGSPPTSLATPPTSQAGPAQPVLELKLPLAPNSTRFAVIGDSGTGETAQYDVAREMDAYRQVVDFPFVIMLGDNIYGGHAPADYARKFELPYKPLLDGGVKFYASLGNHDNPDERLYKPFNMGGERYYIFKKNDVTFIVLDSNYMDPTQLDWLEKQLQNSNSAWKICYFHHPLYSEGKYHGPDLDLRARLTPLFLKYGVNVVFSGHEHVYERIKPQNGIYYFVLGSSGQLRLHNLRPSPETQVGFDTDQEFMLVEIAGDKLYFQTISRTGKTVDSGVLQRQSPPAKSTQSWKSDPSRKPQEYSRQAGFPGRARASGTLPADGMF